MDAFIYIAQLKKDLKVFRDLDSLMKVHNAIDMALVLELMGREEASAMRRDLPTKQQVWIEQKARKATG